MPYSTDKEMRNIDYTNKDFGELKSALIDYAKAYFPNTYSDFNETSPGMMLIEMSAYVGDVLNFYIDQQYREMMLPLAQERRNVINLAKAMGYKVKPVKASFVDMTFSQDVGFVINDEGSRVPNWTSAVKLNSGIIVKSSIDPEIQFETLAPVDFTYSGSAYHQVDQSAFDADGLVNTFKVSRKVKAISGVRRTTSFTVGAPTKFLKLDIPRKDVIEIISVTDSSGKLWYEVDYLAQDKVRMDLHYGDDENRTTAYSIVEEETDTVAVPFTLEYKRVSKRFITQVNEDNTTSLIFGNGLLRNGQELGQEFLDLEQVGLTVPGETSTYDFSGTEFDFTLGDAKSTLGEVPFNTTLTIVYRTGAGITENVGAGNIINIDNATLSDSTDVNLQATNEKPSAGGSGQDTVEEIRNKALAMFTTQNRCVTKEDYEARILNMPAKFGAVAKVYVNRGDEIQYGVADDGVPDPNQINAYILSYNAGKNFTTVKNGTSGELHPLKQNITNYLNEFKIITDDINVVNGYIVNFGVVFDVIAERHYVKSDVKFKCMNAIIEYFNNSKMHFRQAIHTSDLIYKLSGIDGVRAVNFVELTQDFNLYNGGTVSGYNANPLYCNDSLYTTLGTCNPEGAGATYGWKYNFKQFYNPSLAPKSPGLVLPSVTPSVFELKNPGKNIIGVVH